MRIPILPAALMGLMLLAGCRTADHTKGEPDIYRVHQVLMSKRTVPIAYGTPVFNERFKQRQNYFPNAGEFAFGGCLVRDAKRAVVYRCQECQTTETGNGRLSVPHTTLTVLSQFRDPNLETHPHHVPFVGAGLDRLRDQVTPLGFGSAIEERRFE